MEPRHPPISAFARFSDMLKETTKRKPANFNQLDSTPHRQDDDSFSLSSSRRTSRDERRSSTARYTEKMRQMFATTPQRSAGINQLPVEVLQHIFSQLDFWTLLHIQCVSSLWNELIPGDSPLLQEILYLKPSRGLQIYSSVPATFDFDFDIAIKWVDSDRQLSGYSKILKTRKEFSMSRRCTGLIRTSSEIVFHPVIVNLNTYIDCSYFSSKAWKGAEDEQAGSWRDMLVSMPPLRELRLRHGKERNVYRVLSVGEGEEGIRLGTFFRVMEEWAWSSEQG
ncbi:hypothetical protein BKA66DRAFT_527008 [Pyrenochaeta sp. MPI-SDFR-AT-0127]|nr:hypothetical protein BKA66DRAFT_527008 [Pyrenochaeta sp. MPI-SDFR-AT-0127]